MPTLSLNSTVQITWPFISGFLQGVGQSQTWLTGISRVYCTITRVTGCPGVETDQGNQVSMSAWFASVK